MTSPEYMMDCSLAANPLEEAELTSEYKQHQDSPQQDTKLVFCTVPLLLHRGAGEHSLLQERLHPHTPRTPLALPVEKQAQRTTM